MRAVQRAVRVFSPGDACPPADTRRTFLPPRGERPYVTRVALPHRAPDPTELADFLDTYLQDHFNLFADDDSPHEVSVLICRLYELIAANRILEAQQLLSTPTAALDACVAMVLCPRAVFPMPNVAAWKLCARGE